MKSRLVDKSNYDTIRVQKYGNEGPKNSFSKMAYSTVHRVCNCFSMEVIAGVTNTNSNVNKHFYLRNMLGFFSYFFVIQRK